MSECLVTTLKDNVANDLLKLGEIKIHIDRDSFSLLVLNVNNIVTVTALPPGYITDSSGTTNLGSQVTLDGSNSNIYLSQGSYDIIVSNKYGVTGIEHRKNTPTSNAVDLIIDMNDLFGMRSLTKLIFNTNKLSCRYDIANLSHDNFPALVAIYTNATGSNSKLFGDISSLGEQNFSNVELKNHHQIKGDVSNIVNSNIYGFDIGFCDNIYGNLSAFSGCTNLRSLQIYNTAITGNLSSISGLTSLRSCNVANTEITGDTSSLANLTNLTTFDYANTAITGTWPLV